MWLDRSCKDSCTHSCIEMLEKPFFLLALYSNFDASVETYKCSCSNMQVHSVKQITANLCLRVFCHFLCLASDECFKATNWTADQACWMAYVSASNDPPVAGRWQGRRRGTAIWHVNVPECLVFDPAFCSTNVAATLLHAKKTDGTKSTIWTRTWCLNSFEHNRDAFHYAN